MATTFFNPIDLTIRDFAASLKEGYLATYGGLKPENADVLVWACSMALEIISHSDALYHDMYHSILVTFAGQEILRGKHIREGGVTCDDYVNFIVSCLCHDIGYCKGILKADNMKEWKFSTGVGDGMMTLPAGATDAALTPHHVDRGKRFIEERFGTPVNVAGGVLNVAQMQKNIELTRFPVPHDDDHKGTKDYPGLVRAADLLGQLSDPTLMRKYAHLFYEFKETGSADKLGYKTIADLKAGYPSFFWKVVHPFVADAVHYLDATQTGHLLVNNLYANVFRLEHHAQITGQAIVM